MVNKKLAKRVALGILSATMVVSMAPVSAFAATQVVSVDASDANTVTSPDVDVNSSADEKAIAEDLKAAKVTTGASTSKADGWTVKSQTGADYTYGVDSVSDVTFKMNGNGDDIGEANVTLKLSVAKTSDNSGQGTATIVVNLLAADVTTFKYSADQKINAVKTYAEAKAKAANDAKSFGAKDNRLTIAGKLNLDSTSVAKAANLKEIDKDDTASETAAGSTAVDVSIATGAVVDPTTNSDGSIPYTINYTAKDITVTNGVVQKDSKTATSTLSGVISATKAQNDSDYAAKIQNAIKAASWTSDDFKTDSGTKVTSLTTQGKYKLANIIKSADDNTYVAYDSSADDAEKLKYIGTSTFDYDKETDHSNHSVTVSRFTDGVHGKDGAAHLQFFAARNDGTTNKVDSFDVDITVAEGNKRVQRELANAFETATNKAAVSLRTTAVADKDAAVKVVTDAIDAELAKSANGKTYASDIKSYEVKVIKDGFQASTKDATSGYLKFYIKVDTGRTSSSDPTKTDVWYFATKNATETAWDTTTYTTHYYDTADKSIENESVVTEDKAKSTAVVYIDKLAKVDKLAATSISIPATINYNIKTVSSTEGLALKDYVTITPKNANDYTIRWTNSNTDKFELYTGTGDSKTEQTVLTNATDVLPSIRLKDMSNPGSTVVKAELLDNDGNVVAAASTTVTPVNGFDDVQNTSYFAYKSIYNLTGETKLDLSTPYYRIVDKDKNVSFSKKKPTETTSTYTEGYEVVSSPVIYGKGSNKYDPSGDVTRAEYITFMWRQACNDYSYLDATTRAYTKDPASYTGKTDFADVDAKAYYAKAVEWAAKNGIAFGSDAAHFNPNKTITRAEAVSFIYRLKAQGAVYNNYQQFDDVSSSAYYANAVGYARSEGITAGKSGTKFAPNDNVTRGEAAAFIDRASYSHSDMMVGAVKRVGGGYFSDGDAIKMASTID